MTDLQDMRDPMHVHTLAITEAREIARDYFFGNLPDGGINPDEIDYAGLCEIAEDVASSLLDQCRFERIDAAELCDYAYDAVRALVRVSY